MDVTEHPTIESVDGGIEQSDQVPLCCDIPPKKVLWRKTDKYECLSGKWKIKKWSKKWVWLNSTCFAVLKLNLSSSGLATRNWSPQETYFRMLAWSIYFNLQPWMSWMLQFNFNTAQHKPTAKSDLEHLRLSRHAAALRGPLPRSSSRHQAPSRDQAPKCRVKPLLED